MSAYLDIVLQDSLKEQQLQVHLRCKLHMLERKCSSGVEKLKAVFEEHLQNGISTSDLLDKTMSFFTLRKALLSHNGYSKCSREILRLFPSSEEDLAPLCLQQ